ARMFDEEIERQRAWRNAEGGRKEFYHEGTSEPTHDLWARCGVSCNRSWSDDTETVKVRRLAGSPTLATRCPMFVTRRSFCAGLGATGLGCLSKVQRVAAQSAHPANELRVISYNILA